MSKANMIYMCLAALTLSGVIMLTSIAYSAKGEKAMANEVEYTETEISEVSEGYVLKAYNGELAVFRENSEKPYRMLGVDISTFSDYDRQLLSEGILADSQQELNSLIEDYTS